MLSGAWRNFDHIEEQLTLHELIEIVKAQRAKEERDYRMSAALKGIDLDKNKKGSEEDPVEAAKRRVALRRAEEAGLNEQQYEAKESEKRLQQMGFVVVKE